MLCTLWKSNTPEPQGLGGLLGLSDLNAAWAGPPSLSTVIVQFACLSKLCVSLIPHLPHLSISEPGSLPFPSRQPYRLHQLAVLSLCILNAEEARSQLDPPVQERSTACIHTGWKDAEGVEPMPAGSSAASPCHPSHPSFLEWWMTSVCKDTKRPVLTSQGWLQP